MKAKMRDGVFAISPIALALACCLSMGNAVAEPYFDPTLLNLPEGTSIDSIDLSAFTRSESVTAGRYMVTLRINKEDQGQKEIYFSADAAGNIVPEITPALLDEYGVNVEGIPTLRSLPKDEPITSLEAALPDSQVQFDVSKLDLNINIPQVAMRQKSRGAIDPSLLDQGITAFLFNYQVNGSKQKHSGSSASGKNTNDSLYANISGGFNLAAWRLRSNFLYMENKSKSNGYSTSHRESEFSRTTVSRDIQRLDSELVIGETSTLSDVFDSVPFKGIRLLSNEQMLSKGDRGFAPEIRGVSMSNSRIIIRQNGNIIYQTYVAPGPFVINDIYPTGTAGDLEVSVQEEDGTTRVFTQAFSSLPVMQRAGGVKYEVAAGKYDGGITDGSKEQQFIMGTLIYGLPKAITLYTGLLGANHYWSSMVGTGISLGSFGALSMDVTHAQASINHESKQGQSFRVRYSKNLSESGTSVDLTALRYSTKEYYSFADFNQAGYQLKENVAPWLNGRQRSSFQTYINQSLGKWGSIYLRGMRSDYWGKSDTVTTLGIGYNGFYRGINYGIDYSISRTEGNGNWPENKQVSVNMSIPFSIFSEHKHIENINSTFQVSHDNSGRTYQQVGINGQLLDNKLSYQLTESGDNRDQKMTSSVNVGYQGSKGYYGGGYSYGRDSQMMYANASGGMVVHSGGVSLSQYLGNSAAIVYAPDAAGTKVNNGSTVIDANGYGIIPHLSDYTQNIANLDVNTLPENVESKENALNLYPTKGAIVRANFKTLKGYQAMVTLQQPNQVPMGAIASLHQDDSAEEDVISGIVSDNGRVYLSGLPESGQIVIKWGKSGSERCEAPFNMDKSTENAYSSLRNLTLSCH
ncbi:fimbria/pilus outer membrane usher protein [Providencia zhijiangensis]|uniref:Fimbria/pilus outer membrane usher protein n=1 Tax=Providencia zhijiangensis TaxID=3053982 RepID=A0ABZ0N4V3_9GAMM|nr:fimbria/pilus outer membrane usher protein [Providencia sp. D4759]WPA92795.1 fimbria/pilus outer membrane usher protein [Providencia sp. D4759]